MSFSFHGLFMRFLTADFLFSRITFSVSWLFKGALMSSLYQIVFGGQRAAKQAPLQRRIQKQLVGLEVVDELAVAANSVMLPDHMLVYIDRSVVEDVKLTKL
ncbi:hypothetical protein Tco_0052125 [Tanacetum coccineum]